jgi:hypothetical protein
MKDFMQIAYPMQSSLSIEVLKSLALLHESDKITPRAFYDQGIIEHRTVGVEVTGRS